MRLRYSAADEDLPHHAALGVFVDVAVDHPRARLVEARRDAHATLHRHDDRVAAWLAECQPVMLWFAVVYELLCVGVQGLSLILSEVHATESQRVGDDRYRAKTHRRRSEHGAEEKTERRVQDAGRDRHA